MVESMLKECAIEFVRMDGDVNLKQRMDII